MLVEMAISHLNQSLAVIAHINVKTKPNVSIHVGVLLKAGEIAYSAISWTAKNILFPALGDAERAAASSQASEPPAPVVAPRLPVRTNSLPRTSPLSSPLRHFPPAHETQPDSSPSVPRMESVAEPAPLPLPLPPPPEVNRRRTILQRIPRAQHAPAPTIHPIPDLQNLLETFDTITGGRVLVRFTEEQWGNIIAKIEERCNLYVHPARNDEDALTQAKTLSAILAVTVFEAARESDPTHGFPSPANQSWQMALGHRTYHEEASHTCSPTQTCTYLHEGAARNKQRGEIKEAEKALKLYVEEANLQRGKSIDDGH